jgi:biotin carboxyl carrier protein
LKMPEYDVFVDGKNRKVELTRNGENSFSVKVDGKTRKVDVDTDSLSFEKPFTVKIDDEFHRIELPEGQKTREVSVKVDEAVFKVELRIPVRKDALTTFETTAASASKRAAGNRRISEGSVSAPMTGKVVRVKVKEGEQVKAGQVLCVIEAMKMENEIAAPKAGTVKEVCVYEGSSVSEGESLVVIG